jgi:hypothetical protein
MNLYTCKYGIENLNVGKSFYAWIDDELAQGGYELTVNDSDLEEDDEGLYIVTKTDSVKVIKVP